ncbi:MAG: right-handed parallel beta-helix repeat-containing protein [Lacunisphaera sp.]|nr:right-handed parallel beta-helix repeat-containing protein [Lacunisphaera sp.]
MTPFTRRARQGLLRLILSLVGLAASALLLPAREFHVAPDGHDSAAGTAQAPWRTWARAIEAVRESRRTMPAEAVTLLFHGGEYPAESVMLDASLSGSPTAPVVFAAADGQTPVFAGSVRLRDWRPLRDPPPQLPADVASRIVVCNVAAAGVADYGDPTALGLRPELFRDGQAQVLARWPDLGFTHAGKARGATPVGPNWANFTGTVEGVFEYADLRHERWARETDPRLGGYWFWDWAEEFLKLARLEPGPRLIYTEPRHQYGYRDASRYFGLNLLCELDRPGEWYLDRSAGLLYWYPDTLLQPATEVTLTTFTAPYVVTLDGCSFVTLRGLTFRECRGSGILVRGGSDCRIEACRLQRFGRDGIHIEGGFRHGITGSWLEHLGCSGIRLAGGDRRTLTPAAHFIEHTVVSSFSLFKRTYEPAVHVSGCGFRIAHNFFTRSSSSALRLDGNDILVEYNRVSHVVEESDDQGGVDCWYDPSFQGITIRYNHWSDIVGGTHAGAAAVRLDDMISGVTVHGNVFARCGARMFGAVQINGGKANVVENNLFLNCPAAVSFTMPWTEEKWFTQLDGPVIRQKLYQDVDIRAEPYSSRYAVLRHLREDINVNTVRHNLVIGAEELLRHAGTRQIVHDNRQLPATDLPLAALCEPAFLRSHGLTEAIPLAAMGPQRNPWMRP